MQQKNSISVVGELGQKIKEKVIFPQHKSFHLSQLKELYIKHSYTHLQDFHINILLYLLYHISIQLSVLVFDPFQDKFMFLIHLRAELMMKVYSFTLQTQNGKISIISALKEFSYLCNNQFQLVMPIALIKASSFIHQCITFLSTLTHSFLGKGMLCQIIYLTQAMHIHLILLSVQILLFLAWL